MKFLFIKSQFINDTCILHYSKLNKTFFRLVAKFQRYEINVWLIRQACMNSFAECRKIFRPWMNSKILKIEWMNDEYMCVSVHSLLLKRKERTSKKKKCQLNFFAKVILISFCLFTCKQMQYVNTNERFFRSHSSLTSFIIIES